MLRHTSWRRRQVSIEVLGTTAVCAVYLAAASILLVDGAGGAGRHLLMNTRRVSASASVLPGARSHSKPPAVLLRLGSYLQREPVMLPSLPSSSLAKMGRRANAYTAENISVICVDDLPVFLFACPLPPTLSHTPFSFPPPAGRPSWALETAVACA